MEELSNSSYSLSGRSVDFESTDALLPVLQITVFEHYILSKFLTNLKVTEPEHLQIGS